MVLEWVSSATAVDDVTFFMLIVFFTTLYFNCGITKLLLFPPSGSDRSHRTPWPCGSQRGEGKSHYNVVLVLVSLTKCYLLSEHNSLFLKQVQRKPLKNDYRMYSFKFLIVLPHSCNRFLTSLCGECTSDVRVFESIVRGYVFWQAILPTGRIWPIRPQRRSRYPRCPCK